MVKLQLGTILVAYKEKWTLSAKHHDHGTNFDGGKFELDIELRPEAA